jgi:uncharacterized protein YydD (DUF2326 family)
MIHRIFSSLSSFKELQFRPGLNVLLSDKSPEATDRDTRNRAGKTSLIEIIHFLTGATAEVGSIFRSDALVDFFFGMEFDLGQNRVTVERTGLQHRLVHVTEKNWTDWPIQPKKNELTGKYELSNSDWRRVLGAIMYDLEHTGSDDQAGKYGPTFRSLFSYFVRRQSANAFVIPTKQSTEQLLWDQQVAISFLLDLDWTIPKQWQLVRDQEKTLKELKKAAEDGTFGVMIGKTADLRTKLAVAEEHTRQLRESVANFKVLPDYRGMEEEATTLSLQIATLEDDNLIDRELMTELQRASDEEEKPTFNDLEQLYSEIGVVLPNAVNRRFDEVKAFHESVVQNRKSYLSGELESVKRRIANRISRMQQMENRRAELMGLLQSHGALDHLVRIQAELMRQEAETESIRQRFQSAAKFEEKKAESNIERARLLIRLQQDYAEQETKLGEAILAFEKISSELYETAGSLTINPTSNGPVFEVVMPGSKSKGISNMQIFCFDLMLMQLSKERNLGPGFLVHDSHLFDGVDERQVAKALQIGARAAEHLGFQYIITMNSDAIPRELPAGFNLDDYILPIRLTDAMEDGGLFGIRFN